MTLSELKAFVLKIKQEVSKGANTASRIGLAFEYVIDYFNNLVSGMKYSSLPDKPQVNGVELTGNKTSADLKIKEYPDEVKAIISTGTSSNSFGSSEKTTVIDGKTVLFPEETSLIGKGRVLSASNFRDYIPEASQNQSGLMAASQVVQVLKIPNLETKFRLVSLPDSANKDLIFQYIGETTAKLVHGYFYKYVPSENTAELKNNATYYGYVQIDADLFAAAVGFVSGEYFVRADNDTSTGTWKINNDSNATVASASSKGELEALGVLNCFGMTAYPGGFSVNLVSGGPGTWEQVNVQPSVGKKYNNGEIFNDYQNNKSNGLNSHVEGSYNETTVEGSSSHVEGSHNVSKKQSSHVEGGYNVVSGLYAHVEGQKNNASGTSSHVEGVGLEGLVPEDRTYYIGGMGFEGTAKITGDNNQIQCGHSLPESYVGRIVKIYTGSLEFTVTLTEIVASYFASGLLKWEERLDDSLVSEWNASVTACNIVPMVEGGTVDRAPSEAAHAEGLGTVTTNVAEHAEGRFNISHADTIHSIGIGNSDSDRKNAVEVKVNGNAYYYGIGGYNGTNPDTSKSIQEVIEAGGGVDNYFIRLKRKKDTRNASIIIDNFNEKLLGDNYKFLLLRFKYVSPGAGNGRGKRNSGFQFSVPAFGIGPNNAGAWQENVCIWNIDGIVTEMWNGVYNIETPESIPGIDGCIINKVRGSLELPFGFVGVNGLDTYAYPAGYRHTFAKGMKKLIFGVAIFRKDDSRWTRVSNIAQITYRKAIIGDSLQTTCSIKQ